MRNIDKKESFSDTLGLTIIGLMSLGYILFIRPFAELHIQLVFLDFPVFIGELTLFLCLCLFAYKTECNIKNLKKRQWFIIGYFAFVVLKAFYGYWKWGPLAFRHAALLYYPIFILFAYSFFRREFFTQMKSIIISGVLMIMFALRFFDAYWAVSCFILAFILVGSIQDRKIRVILLLALLMVTPYWNFFRTSRMMMVSNFVSGVCLTIGLYLVLKIKRKTRIIILVICMIAIGLGILRFTDKNAAKSIVNLKGLRKAFEFYDQQVVAGMGSYKWPASYRGGLRPVPGDVLESRVERKDPRSEDNLREIQLVRLYNPDKGMDQLWIDKLSLEEMERINLERRMRNWPEEDRLRAQKALQLPTTETDINGEELKRTVKIYNPNKFSLYDRMIERKKETNALDARGNPKERNLQVAVNNAVFRIFIWRDILEEIFYAKPVLGFDLGKPLRSKSLEILGWGSSEWNRDGWIAAHNSYLHIIYRTGLVGIILIVTFLSIFIKVIVDFVRLKSVTGILLVGIMVNWFVAANFLLTFELPYTAIPVWSLFGVTLAYRDIVLKRNRIKESLDGPGE